MPGFDPEDRQTDISGDPPPGRAMSKKEMQGAQQAAVHRTQLPTNAQKGGAAQPDKPESQNGKPPDDASKQPDPNGQPAGDGITPSTPVLGAFEGYQQEADQALGFNPAHGQDWWKHAAESPVETYYLGKHIYNAYYGAFLDPNAEQASVHDIWNQDNAVGWLLRNPVFEQVSGIKGAAQDLGMTPENFAAGAASTALPMAADPSNLLYAGGAARGLALVSKFLLPSAAAAIFANRHSPSDLAWAVLPAMLFGGKLPPGVAEKVAKVAPGASRLFDHLSAAKLAQDESKTKQQDADKLIQHILEKGGMGPVRDTLAPAWEQGMKPLTKEQANALSSSMMERYGTLDPEKLAPLLVRDGASTTMLRNVWTNLARMHYALPFVAEGEGPMVDPLIHKPNLPAEIQQKVEDGYQWTKHMVHQGYLNPTGHNADARVANIRALMGHLRTDKATEQQWIGHLREVAGKEADDPKAWEALSRSIEPSGTEAEAAYQALSPAMKYVRDSVRLVAAATGMAGEELGLWSRVHGYLPRVGLLVKDAKGLRALRGAGRRQTFTTEARVHRTVAARKVDMLTESQIQIEQAYATTKDAQNAVTRQRGYTSEAILNKTPWYDILHESGAGVPVTDRKEIEQIQALIDHDPEAAKVAAEAYAAKLLPEFSQNFWDALPKLGRQIRALSSARAMQDLKSAVDKDGRLVAVETPRNSRELERIASQGYVSLRLPGFHQVMVQKDYAAMLEQMSQLNAKKPPGWLAKILEVEGAAISTIMFAPRIHGINMAGRMGIAMTRFGPDIREYVGAGLLQHGGWTSLPPMIPFVKGESEASAAQYRLIAQNDGVIPPSPSHGLTGGGFAADYIAKIAEMVGDTDMGRVPLVRDMSNSSAVAKASQGAKQVLGKTGDLLWGKQSELWQWVSDFGVMMYWTELAAALNSGRFESAARKAMEAAGTPYSVAEHQRQTRAAAGKFAAARANSWMGHVLPEDTNPWLHATLKSAFFAPNYWRTWGQILTGYYKNAGFGWSGDTIRYVVENEIKTAAAAVLFQQLSSNVLNLVFSGHSIYQNDPGNWGKVEIAQPWAIAAYNEYVKTMLPKDKQQAAMIDPKTGRDAKGAKLTWENPWGRQTIDTEGAMGLLTSAPQWSPQTFFEGFSAFGAARTSPVAQAMAALGNIDLYRSMASDGTRYIDPNHDTFGDPQARLADLITAGSDLTPFSSIGSQIQQQVMQGNVQDIKGPFGLPIPKAVLDGLSVGSLTQDAAKAFLVGMTGTNPPFLRSARTQGTALTDDQYKGVREDQQKYEQEMNSISTAALSGVMPPYQWLAAYRADAQQHAIAMKSDFKHAPDYEYGPLALTNSYEALYDQATDKGGVLQPDKLRSLQDQWRADHSSADYMAVQNELHANDSKYPMVALYHKSMDAYYNWQTDWAKENGIDIETLRSDLSGWSSVYNDRNASRQWLADHPELGQFEAAKKSDFESGQSHYGLAGLMYALFFNPTAADNFLLTTGDTAQQVEQGVQQEQVPTAP